jgi:hypothetical protein
MLIGFGLARSFSIGSGFSWSGICCMLKFCRDYCWGWIWDTGGIICNFIACIADLNSFLK